MNYPTLIKRDPLRFALITIFIFSYSKYLRVPLRAIFDGSSFQWGETVAVSSNQEIIAQISGTGVDGHLPIMLIYSLLFLNIIYAGIRDAEKSFFPLIFVWSSLFLVREVLIASRVENYTLELGTLGVTISYTWIGTSQAAICLLLALVWKFKSKGQAREALDRINTKLLYAALLLTPATVALLRLGPPHDITDFFGVGLLYCQFMLAISALLNWSKKH